MKKITILLLLAILIQLSAKAYSQGITLSLKEAAIEKIFKEIERQSKYHIIYDPKFFLNAGNVSISVTNASIEQVIEICLGNLPLTFSITTAANSKYVIIKNIKTKLNSEDHNSASVNNEPIEVIGKVTDAKGNPVLGATVSVRGSNLSTSTQVDGSFSIKLDSKSSIIITSVGYEPKIVYIKGQSELNIQLTVTSQQMKEVVVLNTGYQKIPKERATGSFVSIDSSIINRSVAPNILDRLDGITPGLLFDRRDPNKLKLQIRGVYSLAEATASPLIVVNNFPYTGDITSINPNDISTITILRDAAAASIWGAKAGNGVIVITTKNGQFNQPLSVNLNTSYGISGKPRLFDLPILSSSEQIDIEKFVFDNGGFEGLLDNPTSPVPLVAKILRDNKLGAISDEDAEKQINSLRNIDTRDDYLKHLYRSNQRQQYALNLSGGSDIVKYYASVGYDKEIRPIITDKNDRITLLFGNSIKITKRLLANINVAYTNATVTEAAPLGYGSVSLGNRALPQYSRIVDDKGNPSVIDYQFREDFLDTLGGGKLLDWKYRPLQEAKFADNKTISNNITAGLNIQYEITAGLTANVSYQYQKQNSTNKNNQNIQSYFTRSMINSYTNLDATNSIQRYPVPMGGILDVINGEITTHNTRGQINYSRNWKSAHSFNALFGGEVGQNKFQSTTFRNYGYNNENLTQVPVDYVNPYPAYYFGYPLNVPYNNKLSKQMNKTVSIYGNASYSYLGKYTLSISARKDASNLFGVKTNQKGRPFYSSGISWKISNENFYNSGFLPNLSIRATIGTGGNVNSGTSAFTTISYVSAENNPITRLPFARVRLLGNTNLRWEQVSTLNLALDFSTKNSVITGTIDFYKKKSSDVFGLRPMDPTTGVQNSSTNAADVDGHGFDLQINSRIIQLKSFKWVSSFNLSFSKYKVKKYLFDNASPGFISDGFVIIPIVGLNPYAIVSYRWAGLDPENGDPRGYVDDKLSKDYEMISQSPFNQQVVRSTAIPQYFGNLFNSFSFRKFSLTTNVTYKFDFYFRKKTISYSNLYYTGNSHTDYRKRWKEKGDENITNVPSAQYPADVLRDAFYQASDINVLRGDHIRWNDIQLSYQLSKNDWKRFPFQSVQFYSTLSNLNVILWRKNIQNIDPENQDFKPTKSWAFGMNVTF